MERKAFFLLLLVISLYALTLANVALNDDHETELERKRNQKKICLARGERCALGPNMKKCCEPSECVKNPLMGAHYCVGGHENCVRKGDRCSLDSDNCCKPFDCVKNSKTEEYKCGLGSGADVKCAKSGNKCSKDTDCCAGYRCRKNKKTKQSTCEVPGRRKCLSRGESCQIGPKAKKCCEPSECVKNPLTGGHYCVGGGERCVRNGDRCSMDSECCEPFLCVKNPKTEQSKCGLGSGAAVKCVKSGNKCSKDSECCAGYRCRKNSKTKQSTCEVPGRRKCLARGERCEIGPNAKKCCDPYKCVKNPLPGGDYCIQGGERNERSYLVDLQEQYSGMESTV